MTLIRNDALDNPYSAFDFSIFQPIKVGAISLECLAIIFARLANGEVPPGLDLNNGVPPIQQDVFDAPQREALDKYRGSRTFLNALFELQRFLDSPNYDDEAKRGIAPSMPFVVDGDPKKPVDERLASAVPAVWQALRRLSEFRFKELNPGTDKSLKDIDPAGLWGRIQEGVLSDQTLASVITARKEIAQYEPFGLLCRYRQHFLYHELKAGPLELVRALAPGESLEVVLSERETTTFDETIEKETELTQTTSTEDRNEVELTDKVASAISKTSSMTMSANGGYNAVLWSANGSATSSLTETSQVTNEQASRRLAETTRKQSEQIRKKTKITTRVVETRSNETTTRHVITNKLKNSVNYGLRRLCYDVDCKIQDLSPLLIWQSFVENPGEFLARSELYDKIWRPDTITHDQVTVQFSFVAGPIRNTYSSFDTALAPLLREQFDKTCVDHDDVELAYFQDAANLKFRLIQCDLFESPETGVLNYNGDASRRVVPNFITASRSLNFTFDGTNIWKEIRCVAEVTLLKRVVTKNRTDNQPENELGAAEERIRAILNFSGVRDRNSLLFEERVALLSKVLVKLIGNRRFAALNVDELQALYFEVNELFDFDNIFFDLDLHEWTEAKAIATATKRRPNYSIFSNMVKPIQAPLGSSLGWEHQIDGDALRDKFINAQWAWVGLPVKVGRERAASEFIERKRILLALNNSFGTMLASLERLRDAETYVATARSESGEAIINRNSLVDPTPRNWLQNEKSISKLRLKWKDVYPIISEHHTVTNVEGFIFDTITVEGKLNDSGGSRSSNASSGVGRKSAAKRR